MFRFVTLTSAAFLALGVSDTAHATPIVLTFDGAVGHSVLDFYNGGAGPNFGVSFSHGIATTSGVRGPDGVIFPSPPGSGPVVVVPYPEIPQPFPPALSLTSGDFTGCTIPGAPCVTMNVFGGFDTALSFIFMAGEGPIITIWEGLNKTGVRLGMASIGTTFDFAPPPPSFPPCCPQGFGVVGIPFNGTAHSVEFALGLHSNVYDNITLGSTTPLTPVPEPATLTLLGVGLGILGASRKRARNRRNRR
jgi:PEP-CTERM motif